MSVWAESADVALGRGGKGQGSSRHYEPDETTKQNIYLPAWVNRLNCCHASGFVESCCRLWIRECHELHT